MRKRLLAVLFTAGIAAGAFSTAAGSSTLSAKAGEEGSPGNKGLCNAYAHNGNNGNGKAFQRLIATAGDYDGDGEMTPADVLSYCQEQVPPVGKPA